MLTALHKTLAARGVSLRVVEAHAQVRDLLRAAGLEQAGKAAEAAPEYEKASESAPTPLSRAAYRSDAARAYLAAGNRDAARRIWESVAADDSSPLAGEARVRIGELNAKPIGS